MKVRPNSFKLSIQPRTMEWESACLSAARSSRDIMAACGRSRMTGQVPPSHFLFLGVQRASRARLRNEELPTRHAEQIRYLPHLLKHGVQYFQQPIART